MIHSHLVRSTFKLTPSFLYAHFSHFPWLDFVVSNWEPCNPKAQATSLASGTVQRAVQDGSNFTL